MALCIPSSIWEIATGYKYQAWKYPSLLAHRILHSIERSINYPAEIFEMKKLIAILSVVLFTNQASAESTVLSSKGAHSLCTTEATHWVDFCNGLIQGYADYAAFEYAKIKIQEVLKG